MEMKGSMADDLASGASDGDQHQLHGGEDASSIVDGAGAAAAGDAPSGPPLFDEFYDDWAAFDRAVAVAIEKHHPIRKRSSLTFEVYNRTVSKGYGGIFTCRTCLALVSGKLGRHDRKSIAEFLSKTFKCTHGIKFRARGNGRRLRHKLRDIGCPFHVYASAVEFGATYRVKVRTQDKHNHPIGPDAVKNIMHTLNDSDYELGSEGEASHAALNGAEEQPHQQVPAAPTSAEMDLQTHFVQAQAQTQDQAVAQAHAQAQAHAHAQAQAQAFAQAQAQVLLKAQHQALAQAQAQAQAHAQAQVQAHAQAQAQAQAQARIQAQAQVQAHANALLQAQAQAHNDMLTAAETHESEALLDSAIESTIGDDFTEVAQPPAKFEETTTLESVRRRMAHFAEERDWNQFHTPRNLVLALTGEVGELCEIFQWKGDDKPVEEWTPEEKVHLGEELSDVLLYLVRLADQCNVDLPTAVHDKMLKNARKYPAELVKGSSKKYNEYKRQRLDTDAALSTTNGSSNSNDSNGSLHTHSTDTSSDNSSETALI